MSSLAKVCSTSVVLLSLLACQDGGTFVVKEAPEGCGVTMDTLDGTVWVMAEAMPDRTDRPNPQARLKWYRENGEQRVKYTVKSLADVYTYSCKKIRDGKEWQCGEIPRVRDWCQALETHEEGHCTAERLKEFGADNVPADELAKAMTEAKETVKKYRDSDNWQQFKLNNNNLGNKLQGLLYAKVNDKRCDLHVTDMYMTIYDGKRRTDSNPVGTNPFMKVEDNYLWEHCDDGQNMVDTEVAERPKRGEVPAKKPHSIGKPIHYHYYGEKGIKAKDDCRYTADTFAQWKPVAQGVEMTVSPKGEVLWGGTHTFNDEAEVEIINPTAPVGVFTMVRYEECGGKRTKIDTICNASQVMP